MSDEFTEYLTELETPNTEGYDFFTRNEGTGYNLEIFRQFNKETGLYRYKGYGELTTVDLETAKKVYCDLEYRKKWDSYCNGDYNTNPEMAPMYLPNASISVLYPAGD
eukprot:sb/3477511/